MGDPLADRQNVINDLRAQAHAHIADAVRAPVAKRWAEIALTNLGEAENWLRNPEATRDRPHFRLVDAAIEQAQQNIASAKSGLPHGDKTEEIG